MIIFFLKLISLIAFTIDPYMVESKVQADIESILSRMLNKERFIVHASADVITQYERKIVEDETLLINNTEEKKAVVILPGFRPDASPKASKPPQQTRQVYKLVEKPTLKALNVQVGFDETLDALMQKRIKEVVYGYLSSNYPRISKTTFYTIPVIKENKKSDEQIKENPMPIKEPQRKEFDFNSLKELIYYILGGIFVLALIAFLRKRKEPKVIEKPTKKEKQISPAPWIPYYAPAFQGSAQQRPHNESQNSSLNSLRNNFLKNILKNSGHFREYFLKLKEDDKKELYLSLHGPAFDSFLDSIGIRTPKTSSGEPSNSEDIILKHEKNFSEFVEAGHWQDSQFFGFLKRLTNEQLLALVTHEDSFTACLMLRFMKSDQSAKVLDALPPARRIDILSQIKSIQNTPLSELVRKEREVRAIVDEMPHHLFGIGAKKEDIEYWGSVLGEADNQDSILETLEKTQPEIYTDLKKYRFKLEDIAALPDGILKKVLSETDNKVLGIALTTCPKDVAEVILEALGAKRRDVLKSELHVYKSVSKEEARQARVELTKSFREAMA